MSCSDSGGYKRCQTPAATYIRISCWMHTFMDESPTNFWRLRSTNEGHQEQWPEGISFVGCFATTTTTVTSCSIHQPQRYKLSRYMYISPNERIFLNAGLVGKTRVKARPHCTFDVPSFDSPRRPTCHRNRRQCEKNEVLCHKAGDRLPLPPGLASCRASLPFG